MARRDRVSPQMRFRQYQAMMDRFDTVVGGPGVQDIEENWQLMIGGDTHNLFLGEWNGVECWAKVSNDADAEFRAPSFRVTCEDPKRAELVSIGRQIAR